MTISCFSKELLRRIRNEIPINRLIAHELQWPSKRREKQFSFVCPRCGESRTATNPRTNLGRCFLCHRNFNTIDFVMAARKYDFVDAVTFLIPLLSPPTLDRSGVAYDPLASGA